MPARSKSQGSTALGDQDAVNLLNDFAIGGQLSIADVRALRLRRKDGVNKLSDGEWTNSIALLRTGDFVRKAQDGHYEITNKGIAAVKNLARAQYRAETH